MREREWEREKERDGENEKEIKKEGKGLRGERKREKNCKNAAKFYFESIWNLEQRN